MASIYKRGRTWWIHYHVNGKSAAKSLKTTSERVARDRKRKLEGLAITDQLAEPSRTPVPECVQAYCEYMIATRTHKSARADLSCLRVFFGPCCKALELGSHVPKKYRKPNVDEPRLKDHLKKRHVPVRNLEQISPAMISGFLQDRITEDGIAPKTANRLRTTLSGLFSYAREHWNYICPDRRFRNPVEGVKPFKERAPQIQYLSTEQIDQQLDAIKNDRLLHAMVATYIFAGLRREEAMWLTPGDVDLKDRLIRVRAKTVDDEFWQPKTRRNRVVPISQRLLAILQAYERNTGARRRPWYFPSPQGCRWNPDNFSQHLRAENAKAGLDWACLIFRHTFGSMLAQKGVSLYKISEMMGNSPEICRRHYAALIPEKMHADVEFGDADVQQPERTEAPANDGCEQPRLRLVR
ncbi:MAG: tyrosine-type recombinase/integrase [Phycisphaeraceae bacterium]